MLNCLFFRRFSLASLALSLTLLSPICHGARTLSQADEKASTRLSDTLNRFTFLYFKRMPKSSKVVTASPYHLFTMLAALSHYTQNDNQMDMKRLLGISNMSPVLGRLSHLNQYIIPKEQGADAIWLNTTESYQTLTITPTIQRLVHVGTLDFRHDPKEATSTIKSWSLARTRLNHWHFPPHMVKNNTQLLLTSLIKGSMPWEYPFSRGRTRLTPFYHDATMDRVPTMHQRHFFPYHEESTFQVAIFPFHDRMHALAVVLPKEHVSLQEVLNHFDQNTLLNSLKEVKYKDLDVSLPRVSLTIDTPDIQPTLQSMGMEIAFQKSHRYHGLSYKPMLLSTIIQSTRLSINEKGHHRLQKTKPKKVINPIHEPKKDILFHANRPFLFFVFDFDTNTISLIGEVNNPA